MRIEILPKAVAAVLSFQMAFPQALFAQSSAPAALNYTTDDVRARVVELFTKDEKGWAFKNSKKEDIGIEELLAQAPREYYTVSPEQSDGRQLAFRVRIGEPKGDKVSFSIMSYNAKTDRGFVSPLARANFALDTQPAPGRTTQALAEKNALRLVQTLQNFERMTMAAHFPAPTTRYPATGTNWTKIFGYTFIGAVGVFALGMAAAKIIPRISQYKYLAGPTITSATYIALFVAVVAAILTAVSLFSDYTEVSQKHEESLEESQSPPQ